MLNNFKNAHKLKKLKIIVIIISLLLLAISLTQCAFVVDNSDDDGCWSSLTALLTGWLYPLGAGICWFANPLLILSCITIFKKPKLALLAAFASFLLAAGFLLFHQVIVDEAGHYGTIKSVSSGYWFWLASCGSILIGSAVCMFYNITEKSSG